VSELLHAASVRIRDGLFNGQTYGDLFADVGVCHAVLAVLDATARCPTIADDERHAAAVLLDAFGGLPAIDVTLLHAARAAGAAS
jgi:hypothetical protein